MSHEWSGGKPGGGGEGYASNPWSFRRDKTFVTLRDGGNGAWSCRADGVAPGGVVLRMEWAAEQKGNWAEFALQRSGSEPLFRGVGSSYSRMCSWNITKKGGNSVSSQKKDKTNWSAPFPKISAADIAGKWTCCCIPGGCSLFEKIALGEDELLHKGCVLLFFVIPTAFQEPRRRSPNTNAFYKVGDISTNVDMYFSSWFSCNGTSCSIKLC